MATIYEDGTIEPGSPGTLCKRFLEDFRRRELIYLQSGNAKLDTGDEEEEDDDEWGQPIFPGSLIRNMEREEMDEYLTMVKASGGFDVPDIWWAANIGVIKPHRGADHSDVEPYVRVAIDRHNADKDKDKQLKLVEIIKCNSQMAAWITYYITFRVIVGDSGAGGDEKVCVYQAKVVSSLHGEGMRDEELTVEIFRQKPDDDDTKFEAGTSGPPSEVATGGGIPVEGTGSCC